MARIANPRQPLPSGDFTDTDSETILNNPSYFVYLLKNINMLNIKKTYLTDEKKRPVAVQVDIKTFERMEQLLEDYALGQFIEENNPAENLSLNEAKEYYRKLKS